MAMIFLSFLFWLKMPYTIDDGHIRLGADGKEEESKVVKRREHWPFAIPSFDFY